MRIAWFALRDPQSPLSGGAEKSILEILTRLVSAGHEIALFTGAWRGAASVSNLDGISCRRLPGTILPHVAVPFILRRFRRFDVIVDDLAHAVPWFSPWFTRAPGVAFFHHLHQRTLHGQLAQPIREIVSGTERLYSSIYRQWPFVTESESSARDLSALGIQRERVIQIPPGVDLGLFRPRKKAPSPQLVYFSGLRRYKRPDLAIEVLSRLHRLGLRPRLVVVGDGPELSSLRIKASALELDSAIDFLGRLRPDALAKVVGESWINLQFAVAEGWGFSVAEAAASGVPTVGFANPGLVDSIRNGVTGSLVPEMDLSSFVRACAEIVADPEPWFDRCLREGRARSWDSVAADWESYLSHVAFNASPH
jgi:glycosyltransferase involved in cell wall biosynthesis